MPKDCPLLSIVIPTRNRREYAANAVDSILSIPRHDFELVVSDNSDGKDLSREIERHTADRRLRYGHTSDHLSMTANHNRALAMARGKYVCIIGDDDTVLPALLDACVWADEEKADALTPGAPVRYCWPDLEHRYWGRRQAGMVYVDRWKGQVKEGNPHKEALACMHRAGQGAGSLPKLYHGLVRRELVEELRAETGTYCFGASPDLYFALALAKKVKKQICTDSPLTIPGSSGRSNSGRAARRQHKGNLATDPHMAQFKNEPWPEGVPKFFSVETVWAQAALEASRTLQWEEIERQFNFPRLHALCLLRHPDYFRSVRTAVSECAIRREAAVPAVWLRALAEAGKALAKDGGYYVTRLRRPTPRGYSEEFGRFPNIGEAAEFVARRFAEELAWKPLA